MRRPHPRHLYRLATTSSARKRWLRERLLDVAAREGVDAMGIRARGHRYFVDPRDSVIGRLLYVEGTYEHAILDRAITVIGIEPDQILDIGANIGTVTVELLSRFPEATAVAFEPDQTNCRLLTQTLAANGLQDRTQVVPVALCDIDGTVELEMDSANFGDHRVRMHGRPGQLAEEQRPRRTVQSRRLETLMSDGDLVLGNCPLVSLDVQGHEGHVLDGGQALLLHPIVTEFWPYGLKRAGGYDRFLSAIEGHTITDLVEHPRTVTVDALRMMDLGLGMRDLLVVP